jgi:hypothetical protein
MCGCNDGAGKPVLLVSYNDNIVRLYDLPTYEFQHTILKLVLKTLFLGGGGVSFSSIGHREESVCLVLHSIAVSYTQLCNDPFSNFCFQVFRKRAALFKGGSKSSASWTRRSSIFWR